MDVLPLVNTSASQGNGPDHQAQIPQVEREREREREREGSVEFRAVDIVIASK